MLRVVKDANKIKVFVETETPSGKRSHLRGDATSQSLTFVQRLQQVWQRRQVSTAQLLIGVVVGGAVAAGGTLVAVMIVPTVFHSVDSSLWSCRGGRLPLKAECVISALYRVRTPTERERAQRGVRTYMTCHTDHCSLDGINYLFVYTFIRR